MSAGAIIARRRRHFIRSFAERGATRPDRAVAFAELGMRRSWIFDQMVARGVFINVGQNRFYMDEQAAHVFQQAQRRRALIVTGILLVFFLVYLLASCRW